MENGFKQNDIQILIKHKSVKSWEAYVVCVAKHILEAFFLTLIFFYIYFPRLRMYYTHFPAKNLKLKMR